MLTGQVCSSWTRPTHTSWLAPARWLHCTELTLRRGSTLLPTGQVAILLSQSFLFSYLCTPNSPLSKTMKYTCNSEQSTEIQNTHGRYRVQGNQQPRQIVQRAGDASGCRKIRLSARCLRCRVHAVADPSQSSGANQRSGPGSLICQVHHHDTRFTFSIASSTANTTFML